MTMPNRVKIVAPLNGRISVKAVQGRYVTEGDLIALQISGKTESQIRAPKAGCVKSIVAEGTGLNENETVAELEV